MRSHWIAVLLILAGCGGGGDDTQPHLPNFGTGKTFGEVAYTNRTDTAAYVELHAETQARTTQALTNDQQGVETVWRRFASTVVMGGGAQRFQPGASFEPITFDHVVIANPGETVVLRVMGDPPVAFELQGGIARLRYQRLCGGAPCGDVGEVHSLLTP